MRTMKQEFELPTLKRNSSVRLMRTMTLKTLLKTLLKTKSEILGKKNQQHLKL